MDDKNIQKYLPQVLNDSTEMFNRISELLVQAMANYQSRLKTIGGPRQNINEGPHKTNSLAWHTIPLGIELFL